MSGRQPLWPSASVFARRSEHRPDDLARERRPDAGRVAHQQVLLEPAGLGGRDRGRREVAEPGRHAVDDGALGDQRLDDVARLLHPLAGVDVERGVGAVAGDRLDVGDRQVGAGQDDRPDGPSAGGPDRSCRLPGPGRSAGPPAHSPCRG